MMAHAFGDVASETCEDVSIEYRIRGDLLRDPQLLIG